MTEFFEIENVFDDFDRVREYFDTATFEDKTNPVDGVVYPNIHEAIPEDIELQLVDRINDALADNLEVKEGIMFARLSPEGVEAPHQVHTDISMGSHSCMVFLNRKEDCEGGTAFVQHETGLFHHPINDTDLDIWKRDCNITDKWETVARCEMEPNKACIFNSVLMHRAEPVEGFGTNAKDGRLVLTFFFNIGEMH